MLYEKINAKQKQKIEIIYFQKIDIFQALSTGEHYNRLCLWAMHL